MEEALRLSEPKQRLDMYAGYREKYPRAQAPQRIPLAIAEGLSFQITLILRIFDDVPNFR